MARSASSGLGITRGNRRSDGNGFDRGGAADLTRPDGGGTHSFILIRINPRGRPPEDPWKSLGPPVYTPKDRIHDEC